LRPQPDEVEPIAENVEPGPSTKAVDPAEALMTPDQHAEALKAVKTVTRSARVNGEPKQFKLYHWQHAAAAALHGWAQHAHHEAEPIKISRKDYEAALKAASYPVTRVVGADGTPGEQIESYEAAKKGVPTVTDYEPHKPALSIHYEKAV